MYYGCVEGEQALPCHRFANGTMEGQRVGRDISDDLDSTQIVIERVRENPTAQKPHASARVLYEPGRAKVRKYQGNVAARALA